MRAFVFVALALLAVTATAEKVTERDGLPVVYDYKFGDKCPADEFYFDCNFCGCGKDGRTAFCTKMMCLPQKIVHRLAQEKLPVVMNFKEGDKCPAQRFYHDCNFCFCAADGHSAGCTKMMCPPRPIPLKRAIFESKKSDVIYAPNYKYGDKCPGKYFTQDGCNVCVCVDNDVSPACTVKKCVFPPPVPQKRALFESNRIEVIYTPNYKSGDKCPAQYFSQDGCNTCICSEDGITAGCTRMLCLPSNSE